MSMTPPKEWRLLACQCLKGLAHGDFVESGPLNDVVQHGSFLLAVVAQLDDGF